jgi:dimethylsulfone monooxygenase
MMPASHNAADGAARVDRTSGALAARARRRHNSLHGPNRLRLGIFGANCSSGLAVTTVPERWDATWENNEAVAKLADAAGIEFMLPIARWRGYGGTTDFHNSTFETITWACGLLAATKDLTVFGTVHVPLIHPIVAAKQIVTIDQMSRGRFGLNIVCGWNEDEFAMFGEAPLAHDERYALGAEWISVISQLWERTEPFDFDGKHFQLRGLRGDPKPYHGTRPLIMNAGSSPAGQDFALHHADFLFRGLRSIEQGAQDVATARSTAAAIGREVGCFSAAYVLCRPTMREAEDYLHYYAAENGDWTAVDHIVEMGGRNSASLDPEVYKRLRIRFAAGHGGYPLVGTPDHIAEEMAKISQAGFTGLALSFVDYLTEFPYFRDEVMPRLERLGVREPLTD